MSWADSYALQVERKDEWLREEEKRMSLFVCSQCRAVDNTAVTNYWTRPKGSPPLCSECDPKIGKWHGKFSKEEFTEADRGEVVNPPPLSQTSTPATPQGD